MMTAALVSIISRVITSQQFFLYNSITFISISIASIPVPDYLLWNGNLAIAESDVRYALIIWIKPFHQGISQGVLFNDYKDLNTQIMLSSSKKAEDQEDQWIVDENSTILTTIFEKANKVWNLGLK
jgi:hypothetical protein